MIFSQKFSLAELTIVQVFCIVKATHKNDYFVMILSAQF